MKPFAFQNRYFPLGAIIVSLYCQLSVMCIVLALTVSQSMFKQIQLYPRRSPILLRWLVTSIMNDSDVHPLLE